MTLRELTTPAFIFVELGQDLLRAERGSQSLEMPISRVADGRLTDGCKNEIKAGLQKLIDHKAWQPRARVYCAIHARGVSLRRLQLPTDNKDEVKRLLPFQIEREFPLSPDQLAWGAQE